MLRPKFGKESDLWVQLDEESIWRKEGFLRCIRQKDLRSAICSVRQGNSWADFADWTMTWLKQEGRMDG
jgi:hypothetical protein